MLGSSAEVRDEREREREAWGDSHASLRLIRIVLNMSYHVSILLKQLHQNNAEREREEDPCADGWVKIERLHHRR